MDGEFIVTGTFEVDFRGGAHLEGSALDGNHLEGNAIDGYGFLLAVRDFARDPVFLKDFLPESGSGFARGNGYAEACGWRFGVRFQGFAGVWLAVFLSLAAAAEGAGAIVLGVLAPFPEASGQGGVSAGSVFPLRFSGKAERYAG